VELVAGQGQGLEDMPVELAFRVFAGVEHGLDFESGRGRGGLDRGDDDFVAGQWSPAPAVGDLGEEPVLDLVPLRSARRQVAHGDLQAGLERELGQAHLPQPVAVCVAPAGVGGDQQAAGARILARPLSPPPAADGFHCELSGITPGPDVHPPGVRGDIVDAVRDRHRHPGSVEGVRGDLHRITLRPKLPARGAEAADVLLLLRIDADDRRPAPVVLGHLPVQVPELGVTVGMADTLQHFRGTLQTES
jgi:hypothetical protein